MSYKYLGMLPPPPKVPTMNFDGSSNLVRPNPPQLDVNSVDPLPTTPVGQEPMPAHPQPQAPLPRPPRPTHDHRCLPHHHHHHHHHHPIPSSHPIMPPPPPRPPITPPPPPPPINTTSKSATSHHHNPTLMSPSLHHHLHHLLFHHNPSLQFLNPKPPPLHQHNHQLCHNPPQLKLQSLNQLTSMKMSSSSKCELLPTEYSFT